MWPLLKSTPTNSPSGLLAAATSKLIPAPQPSSQYRYGCVIAGALLLGERMDGRGYLGCALMLAAVLLAQLGSLLIPEKERNHV